MKKKSLLFLFLTTIMVAVVACSQPKAQTHARPTAKTAATQLLEVTVKAKQHIQLANFFTNQSLKDTTFKNSLTTGMTSAFGKDKQSPALKAATNKVTQAIEQKLRKDAQYEITKVHQTKKYTEITAKIRGLDLTAIGKSLNTQLQQKMPVLMKNDPTAYQRMLNDKSLLYQQVLSFYPKAIADSQISTTPQTISLKLAKKHATSQKWTLLAGKQTEARINQALLGLSTPTVSQQKNQ